MSYAGGRDRRVIILLASPKYILLGLSTVIIFSGMGLRVEVDGDGGGVMG